MTVAELIQILQAVDGNLWVVKTNEDGEIEEMSHVDLLIGAGLFNKDVVVEIT